MAIDPRAAEVVAAAIDASPTRVVVGLAADIEPIFPHLQRGSGLRKVRGGGLRAPLSVSRAWDERIRPATMADLPGLVPLYDDYPLITLDSPMRWLALLYRFVSRGEMLVAEVATQLRGGFWMEHRSSNYAYWSGLWVPPEFRYERGQASRDCGGRRRTSLGHALMDSALKMTAEMNLGFSAMVSPTNQMPVRIRYTANKTVPGSYEEWAEAVLTEPHRFPGQRSARRSLAKVEEHVFPSAILAARIVFSCTAAAKRIRPTGNDLASRTDLAPKN